MPRLDDYESMFRSAIREPFVHEPPRPERVVVVTDLAPPEAAVYESAVKGMLEPVLPEQAVWRLVSGEAYGDVGELLALLEAERAQLVCTYRNLHHPSWRWPYTLGSYVDVMAQAFAAPILLTPSPHRVGRPDLDLPAPASVVALTDHLLGDDRLVNWAADLTVRGGTLLLTHIESLGTFEYYLEALSRIPGIDTELAREQLARKLLELPRDYIATCRRVLEEAGVQIEVQEHVALAHRLEEMRRLKRTHEAQLVVLNAKDPAQQAMHAISYPLAVELRRVPMLLL